MTAPGAPGAPARLPGRPRSEKARKAILDAAAELLLARGLSSVSMDAVAEQAGVSKATIYRWWPNKEALALDAIYEAWAGDMVEEPDTGSLREDLLALLRPWVRRVTDRPPARVVAALIAAAHSDPAFGAEYRARLVEPRRELARAVFRRAVERGEVSPDRPVEVALDLIYGALYHRLLHGHAPLSEAFLQEAVDTTLRGIAPRATGPRPAR